MFLLESSTLVTLDPKTKALVTSGESTLGRVSLGGGQIVIEDIHVSASITNDGAGVPTHKAAVSVGAASIGGVPVTIDQDGVHVRGQRQGLPYKQASDALNGALKQAGIELFLVAPEITTDSCEEPGTGTDTGTGTTTNPSDQSGTGATADSCEQPGATDACEEPSTGTGTTTSTTTTPTPPIPPTTTTTPDDQEDTTTTPSSCGETGTTPPPSSCEPTGTTTGTTTTSSDQEGTTTTSSSDQTGPDTGITNFGGNSSENSGAMTISATGLHVAFAPPARQAGVPAQHAEYILGEVFLDSLAVPLGPVPSLDPSSSSLSSSSCPGGGQSPGATSGGALTGGGGSLTGGSISSGALSPTASGFGSTSQPTASSTTGNSLPAAFAAALKKPLWLLLAYVLWQSIVIGTGLSVWNWRRGPAS